MLKLLYKPVAIVAGIVGGLLSGLIFKGSGRSSAADLTRWTGEVAQPVARSVARGTGQPGARR